jgi:putative two-component system response regulator
MKKKKEEWDIQEITQNSEENQLIFDVSMDIVSQLAETRDEGSAHHITRIKATMEILARRLAKDPKYTSLIDETYIDLIVKACPFHDIGKVNISDKILLKPGLLTEEEYGHMKEHVMNGVNSILSVLKRFEISDPLQSTSQSRVQAFFKETLYIVKSHHEHYDGSGYPQGLKGEEIPLSARIMALIDVFDALTHRRIYKPAWTIKKAVEYIEMQSGYQFDPDCVGALMAELDKVKAIYQRFGDE